ncbi:D-malate degradation protein R [Cedecea neteri]|uniref:D-malate degradation protein R n=1 Tax=Cedecea neteri TaxID=158822 RepID=A0A291DVQ1_9ENTR|nr:LysR family transcriptional regulator [Cedecea neteri]ATF91779.1 LysR family transcriptional regulator [Cedecea neteri]SQC91130.1 D-malate degradation protein R [Cedecea neteri]
MIFNDRTFDGLSVFTAVVESGTFAAAAEVINMSPPGVSRAIARLEKRLGIRLFDRTTRAVALTVEGKEFYRQILPLLVALEDVTSTASLSTKAVTGRLRVNIDPFFSSLILGPQLETFMSRYPELELDLVTSDRLGDMIGDGFDLAIRFGVPRNSTLVARKLLETRIMTVATPAYLARHGRPETPQALLAHTCIHFRDPETGRPFEWEFHRKGEVIKVPVSGRLTLNDARTLHEACLSGHAIAQMMTFGSGELVKKGQLVDLFPDWPDERFPLYAYYPSRINPAARTRCFLDFILELAKG